MGPRDGAVDLPDKLGDGGFVERILREADAPALRQHVARKVYTSSGIVADECKERSVGALPCGLSVNERRRAVRSYPREFSFANRWAFPPS